MPKRAGMVRCLGPGREHTFCSRDWSKNRICPRCKRKLEEMRLPPIVEQPARDPTRDTPGER